MPITHKIVAFDIDGTLAESKVPITPEMAELLHKLSQKAKVAIISGASFAIFQTQLLTSLIPSSNIILLPTDGSERFEYNTASGKWELTEKEAFPEHLKEKAMKALQEVIATEEFGIPKEHEGEYIEDRDTEITFSAMGQHANLAKKAIWDPHQEKRQKIKKFLDERLPELTTSIGGTTSIDILPKGFNKGVGLTLLLKKLGLEKKDMVFVGDALFPGGNDYSAYEAGIESIKVSGPAETSGIIKQWLQ